MRLATFSGRKPEGDLVEVPHAGKVKLGDVHCFGVSCSFLSSSFFLSLSFAEAHGLKAMLAQNSAMNAAELMCFIRES